MNKGGTRTNGLEGKENDDNSQSFTPKRWHRQTLCVKKRRRRRTHLHWRRRRCNNLRTRGIHKKEQRKKTICTRQSQQCQQKDKE